MVGVRRCPVEIARCGNGDGEARSVQSIGAGVAQFVARRFDDDGAKPTAPVIDCIVPSDQRIGSEAVDDIAVLTGSIARRRTPAVIDHIEIRALRNGRVESGWRRGIDKQLAVWIEDIDAGQVAFIGDPHGAAAVRLRPDQPRH